jgi:hypothetical protein
MGKIDPIDWPILDDWTLYKGSGIGGACLPSDPEDQWSTIGTMEFNDYGINIKAWFAAGRNGTCWGMGFAQSLENYWFYCEKIEEL